ncbi:hypothetical protein [Candidatus Frankia alpina]|uniref:hypothetical protein n=1 Tax=Candidatus Frankia alpina TaxID=2699483 RepID=UPI001F15AB0A|nr:hypothetical protein [Candidatus Frankia alpina]
MDNLNAHGIASLHEAFDPTTAFALAQRLEIHHTPRHGSWLNTTEIEPWSPAPPMPRPPHQRPRHRTRRLAERHQHQPAPSPMARHHQRRPHQTPPPIPQTLAATLY